MLYLGVDPHKENHVISTCDESSRQGKSKSIKANIEGYAQALEWVKEQSSERIWGIENPQSYGRGFAQYLVSKGEKVLNVPPHLTGKYRSRSMSRGKTDKHDALAVARATLQEQDKLVPVLAESQADILNILVEHHDNLKGEKNRLINRLHAHLRELEIKEELDLTTKKALKSLIERAKPGIKSVTETRWKAVISLCKRIIEIIEELKQIDKDLSECLKPLNAEPLLEIEGVGEYLAAKIIGIVGNPSLFRSEASFANYGGVAPIPCSSGKNTKYRVNPGGNRQLNSAFYQIMKTQFRCYPPAKEYKERKISEGKTNREANRCLKRMISKRVFKALNRIESLKEVSKQI